MNREEFMKVLEQFLKEYFNKYGNKWTMGHDLLYYFKKSKYFDSNTMLKREYVGMMEFRHNLLSIGLKHNNCGCGTIGKFKMNA